MTPTQDLLTDIELPDIRYSTFWQRFFASIIDSFVLAPILIVDNVNKTSWKSLPILFLSFLVGLAYKPIMESKYGATVGKMALKLKIVNTEYQKAGIKNIVLRNIFDILNRLIIGLTTFFTFTNTEFADVTTTSDYTKLYNSAMSGAVVTLGLAALILVDSIVMIADRRRQSLHDKIGQTFVIQK